MAGSAPIAKRDVHLKRTFQAFENRGYVRLWLANFLLYTSRWMQMTLMAWLILDLTDSPFLVALVGFFSSAPMFLLGLVGGVLADRVHRQRLLSLTQGTNVTSSCHAHAAAQYWRRPGVACIHGHSDYRSLLGP